MVIKEQEDNTNVILGSGTTIRTKMMFFIQMMAFGFIAIFCLSGVVSGIRQSKIAVTLLGAAFSGVLLIICWRFLSRITRTEELSIAASALTLIRYTNGRKSTAVYPVEGIQNLCYIGSDAAVRHPLQSDNLDPLGFGARQNLVQSVMAEGNVIFYYDARQIRFGTGLSSWDAETLNKLILGKTKGALFIAGLPEDIPESVWNR